MMTNAIQWSVTEPEIRWKSCGQV